MSQIDIKIEYKGKSRTIAIEAQNHEARKFLANIQFVKRIDPNRFEVSSLADYSQLLSFARRHAQTIQVND